MYLDFLVKVPTVKGKITRRKKSNVVYIEYEYDRVYDPSRKYTFLKRVTIGKLSDTDPELMKPNQNFLKYFPDAELPESKNRTSRSSCLRVGTYFVLRKIIEECSLNDILDHAVTANQKVILKAFGLDANSIKYFASEMSKELKEAELRKENKDGKNKKNK